MTEVFGAVAGAISIAALFNNCIDCFDYIQLAKSFGEDFSRYQLRLDVAKCRLSRWGAAIDINNDSRFLGDASADPTVELAMNMLREIVERFGAAHRVSLWYKATSTEQQSTAICTEADLETVSQRLHNRFRRLAIQRQNRVSLIKKAYWAIYDKRYMGKVIDDIFDFLNELEKVFPAPPQAITQLVEMEISEVNDQQELKMIQDVAKDLDLVLEAATKSKFREITGKNTAHILFLTMNALLSRTELITVLEKIISTQNEGEWTILESLVQPNILIDGDSQQRSEFIADLRSRVQSGSTSKLDSYVVDTNAQAIAARIIKTETASSTERFEYQEIILAWFVDGRLSNLKTLRDNDARRAKQASETATSSLLQEAKPTSIDLDALYCAYIKSINDQTMEANFETFCKPVVSHNAVEKTIAQYIALIQESQSAIQGLHFEIQDLIVDNDLGRVAARLEFTGAPVKRWADADATGDSVRFHEHVMYWFDEGKMHWVWSIVDLDTYRKQLLVDI
ncbi:hypothetical protein KAF25_000380 [Fusarium avenaceum]|uniref:Prion-inhibition and propagation HeLo domain-containing protein n=1 Tax=Fusarium avenaceum TaxID=40199 RepID=A0A9P7H3F2_9HYPO|nr:hypothetical protein KAF25_000380 [Fusarium avenaceum]